MFMFFGSDQSMAYYKNRKKHCHKRREDMAGKIATKDVILKFLLVV
jgi:hypothetical protein